MGVSGIANVDLADRCNRKLQCAFVMVLKADESLDGFPYHLGDAAFLRRKDSNPHDLTMHPSNTMPLSNRAEKIETGFFKKLLCYHCTISREKDGRSGIEPESRAGARSTRILHFGKNFDKRMKTNAVRYLLYR